MKAREDAVRGRDAELARSMEAQATEGGRLEKLEEKVRSNPAGLPISILRTCPWISDI